MPRSYSTFDTPLCAMLYSRENFWSSHETVADSGFSGTRVVFIAYSSDRLVPCREYGTSEWMNYCRREIS